MSGSSAAARPTGAAAGRASRRLGRQLAAADERVLRLVPADFASRRLALPLRRAGRTLTVAMTDPSDHDLIDDLAFLTRFEIEPLAVGEPTLRQLIERSYGAGADGDLPPAPARRAPPRRTGAGDARAVELVEELLRDAVRQGASDAHLEPYEGELRVRFRLDGKLREVMRPPPELAAAVVSRLKILADLDIAERRVPQDGRMRVRSGERDVDFRVSTLPTLFGERIALRVLDRARQVLDLASLGMERRAERALLTALDQPTGMILVTGPTGSGKTTTLYSALARLNRSDVNIMTAEDPVEFNLRGVNQVQVRPKIGLTFASALRAFLRQDPNIVMVGEMRDAETGGIAVKAALTGHLVLSTLHANDAAATATRLVDMGVEAFNVAAAVTLVTAQRLVRRICEGCRVEVGHPDEQLRAAGVSTSPGDVWRLHRGTGCEACGGSGYAGRQGLYEVLPVSPAIRRLVLAGASTGEIRRRAVAEGMLTLREDGLLKARRGVTTLSEVLGETPA